ncbi:MAG: N-acetylmuramoyl-L-alanine amidase-like domain-containing protein [Bacteroidota bacterium]
MKHISIFLILIFCCLSFSPLAAQLYCTKQNKELCELKLKGLEAKSWNGQEIGNIATQVGKEFLGTPYVGKTLEVGEDEQLVIDLQGLDCTTFIENVIVFSRLIKDKKLDFDSFQQELKFLRYRDGKLDNYTSRLHYFTEWISNNESKGIIKDISQDIGGQSYDKHINFMSTHRSAYAQLSSDIFLGEIKEVEQKLNQKKRYFLPKHKVSELEKGIQSGDLIAITTSIKGLDVSHTGMAIELNGRIHLLHASSISKKVEISAVPLADYLQKSKSQSGIMVCRLMENV